MGRVKNRHTLWLYDDTWGLVGSHYKDHNCTTQNEFIEQAIRFYCGYLDADRDGTLALTATGSAVLVSDDTERVTGLSVSPAEE